MILEKEQDDFFLVQLPDRVAGKPVAEVKAYASTNEIPARVVWLENSVVTVLVDARAARRSQMVKIYPVPGEAPVAAAAPQGMDPAPLRGLARRTAGMDFPATLADASTLETRCDAKAECFTVADFSKLGGTFKEWFRGDWTRKNHLVDLQTWLFVPKEGNYLFGLAGVAPAWLLLDGVPVMEHPAGQPFDKWTAGKEVAVKAGLRRLQVRTVCRQEIDTGVAWKRAGEPGVAADVAMVTGGDLCEGRWEWLDKRLHPYAAVESGASYRFVGTDDVFVPFTFKDGTSCWGTNHVASWKVGDRVVGEGEKVLATLRASALPAQLTLTAKAESGEESAYERLLTYNGPVWSQVEVSSRLTGVPAVCYEDDRVHPIIRMRTTAADGLEYDLHSEVEWLSGLRTNRLDRLVTDKGWGRVYLDEMEVGGIAAFSWSLRHCGAEISKGKACILREPFDRLPDAVSGESLKAGDEFVILLASKASRGDPAIRASSSGTNGVAVLDGFIYAALGEPAEGDSKRRAGGWRLIDLQAVEQNESASGMSLLLPFAALKQAMPASVVVFAPSFLSISREGGTVGFERRLSAMTGLLNSSASGQPRVLLVVPPAFDVLPGCGCVAGDEPCVHAADARGYAEIVIRVADAHGVETVDLFTAFQTASGPADRLVRNGVLTPEGASLAELLIEKKVSGR